MPLERLLDATHPIPIFVDKAIAYLEQLQSTKGLFTGNADKEKILKLKTKVDGGEQVEFEDFGPEVASELLRRFFEQLPEPVIPEEICEAFLSATGMCAFPFQFWQESHGVSPAEIEFFPNFRNNAFHSLLFTLPSYCRELLER